MKKPLLATVLLLCPFAAFPAAEKPNIVLILVDDMGYADTQPYGSEIRTPNLMNLAENGLRFSRFYNCAKCAPTRSSLMTGLYPQQAGMAANPHESGAEIPPNAVSLGEVLRSAGYATYVSGKWHLTGNRDETDLAKKNGWPLQRGFDRFFGFLDGTSTYLDADKKNVDNEPATEKDIPPGSYLTDVIADHAVTFLSDHAKTQPTKPFFLYLPFNAPHAPYIAKEEDAKSYEGVYDVGWDVLRERRLAKQKELGVMPPGCQLSPRLEKCPAWETLTPAKKQEAAQVMSIYAGMITCMDRGVGRVLETLDQIHQRDNTVIFFLSDNGCGVSKDEPNLKTYKKNEQKPKGYQAASEIGAPWGNVANTPFNYGKGYTWEGGIATELIINWPQGMPKTVRGTVTQEFGHVVDLMATCVDLAQATYPTKFNDHDIMPMEGFSLVPTMLGKPLGARRFCWRYGHNDAALDGTWKILRHKESDPWLLFDLKTDPSELHDQAATHPEILKKLVQQWQDWSDRVGAEAFTESKKKKTK